MFANATTILDSQAEPQPDLCMLIANPLHGQTRDEDEYIVGAQELIVEVASSSESIDLHRKHNDYERTGVKEYLVVLLRQERIAWFIRRNANFEELSAGGDGLYRSEVFLVCGWMPRRCFTRTTDASWMCCSRDWRRRTTCSLLRGWLRREC